MSALPRRALEPVEDLPKAPASDVKKLGWRGLMRLVARDGRLLVTNHRQPEAVILPVAEYTRLLELAEDAASRDEAALDALRRKFDARLASLDEPGAHAAMDALFDKPLDPGGRVIAGESF